MEIDLTYFSDSITPGTCDDISDRFVWPTMWSEHILGGGITEMLMVGKITSNIVVTRTDF